LLHTITLLFPYTIIAAQRQQSEFNEALKEAYKKSVGKINIPGFRKGKAPMGVIEKMYGTEIFYEDASNIIIPDAYDEEVSAETSIVSFAIPFSSFSTCILIF